MITPLPEFMMYRFTSIFSNVRCGLSALADWPPFSRMKTFLMKTMNQPLSDTLLA